MASKRKLKKKLNQWRRPEEKPPDLTEEEGDMITWAKDAPGMGYKEPEIKDERCGTCFHSEVTGVGAALPDYQCVLMRSVFLKAKIKNRNPCVDNLLGICDRYKNRRDTMAEAAAKKVQGAGI